MRKRDVIPEGSCQKDDCRQDATEILFATVEFFGVEKQVKVPLCKTHHTLAVGEATRGLSVGEPGNPGS